jgi:hypothetical protein
MSVLPIFDFSVQQQEDFSGALHAPVSHSPQIHPVSTPVSTPALVQINPWCVPPGVLRQPMADAVGDGNKSLYLVFVGVVFFSASWTAFTAVRTASWTAFRAVRTIASWLFC